MKQSDNVHAPAPLLPIRKEQVTGRPQGLSANAINILTKSGHSAVAVHPNNIQT
jgi:hypothetical protein